MFMAGECYGLSLDLVQYIAASPALRTMTRGKEDKLVSRWMRMHPEREEIVWLAERCWIYDHPKAGTVYVCAITHQGPANERYSYSHGFLFPSTVAEIRKDNLTGLHLPIIDARGGEESVEAYSTVSKFGTAYRPPSDDMSVIQQIEALIEGSPLSLLSSNTTDASGNQKNQAYHKTPSVRHQIYWTFASRPTRMERFLGDPEESGGTVVVHYIKKPDWFVETMIALLGTSDEQGIPHRGVGMWYGAAETRKGRVFEASVAGGVKMGKDGGL